MASSFEARMLELSDLVGKGKISSIVKIDQVYARRQHQGANYRHPRGGQAFFLREALHGTFRPHLQRVALQIFRGNVSALFIRYGEHLASEAKKRTPVELGNLKDSGSVIVKDQGRIIYRRKAAQRRMTRKELNSRVRAHHMQSIRERFNRRL